MSEVPWGIYYCCLDGFASLLKLAGGGRTAAFSTQLTNTACFTSLGTMADAGQAAFRGVHI